jgi:hypothetical protein
MSPAAATETIAGVVPVLLSAVVQEAEAGPLEVHAKGEALGIGVGVASVLPPVVEPQAANNTAIATSTPTLTEMSVLTL